MAVTEPLGDAFVEVRARLDKLERGFDKARTESRKGGRKAGAAFARGFSERSRKLIGPAIGGLLSAAAARQLLRSTEKVVDSLDSIGKTADRVGLSTQALQELRFAADLTGVAQRNLDLAMQRFTRRTAEAAQGTGEAKAALAEMGIELRNADGSLRTTDELLNDVADAFQSIEDPSTRVRLAFKLFDSEGVALVNTLKNGSAELERMRKQARDLGLVFEDDLVRGAEKTKEQLTILRKVIEADLSRALIDLAPLIVDITRFLAQLAKGAASAYQGILLVIGSPVREASVRKFQITEELEALDQAAADVQETLDNFAATGSTTRAFDIPGLPGLSQNQEDPNAVLDALTKRTLEIQARREELQRELSGLSDLQDPLVKTDPKIDLGTGTTFTPPSSGGSSAGESEIDKRREDFQSLTESIQEAIAAEQEERQEIQATADTIGQSESARELLIESLRAQRQEQEILAEAQEAGLSVTSDEVQEALRLARALNTVTNARIMDEEALERHSEAVAAAEERERALASALENTGQRLIDAAFNGGDFTRIIADLIIQLIELELRALAAGAATQSIGTGGGGGGFLSGLFGGGGGGGGFLGSLFGGLFGGGGGGAFPLNTGQLVGFADGGFAQKGTFAVVGEEGPELGVFGQAARIFSNKELNEVLNAPKQETEVIRQAAPEITFNVQTPDVGSFRRSAPNMAAELQALLTTGNRQI